ncbi:ISL3 family transposase [Streptomyces sp. NBC_00249]|uniref:ISL3 family transposase n=1 Tax=Streptomyces sp. NBC_00249 TaxID=2975690 RepID=UPI00224FC332|nr:ISL3 family transposase [Streptomyces sp. NBC_00249]MCX5199815.1 ISL3 family transposase [Streptomyces sp. NBC_00249]
MCSVELASVLPELANVLVVSVEVSDAVVAVHASTRSGVPAGCAGCGQLSDWCHSRYVRRLADVALGGKPLRVDLSVRRLYCENTACPKVTFAEQVPGLTVRYQRRTPRLQGLVEDVGVVLAGRGGSRMLRILNVRLSRVAVLSQLMRVPLPPLVTPQVLGVDDFALYGGTYGTLLVDATTRLPLTLWEGRDAEQLGRWLREHPGVEVACRDGSLTYRQGIAAGAPEAVQVSDRFHLWQGLSRRVQDIASAHRGCLPAALPTVSENDPPPIEETTENAAADTRAERHAQSLFEAVQALTRTGRSHSSVARELGLDRRTVGKYARARTWQEVIRRPPRKPSTLDPYLDYLRQRWDEGQHSATILHEELQAKGYLGHYQRVKMAVAPLRRGLPLDEPRERPPSPREAARWITTHPHRRSPHINERLPRLLDHCPELKLTHDLVGRFATMVDNHDAAPLPGWLSELANSGLAPLAGLAGALHEDRHAVAQGITTPYNSGVNEGRITDVKLQKRLMAGRAGVSLLRHRVVLIAHLRRRYADPSTVSPR